MGFLVPIAGLVLYLVFESERPRTAKAVGIGGLVGFILQVGFYGISLIGCYLIGG